MKQPTDPIAITLEAQQWNVILAALAEAPWRISDPLIRAIRQQADADKETAATFQSAAAAE